MGMKNKLLQSGMPQNEFNKYYERAKIIDELTELKKRGVDLKKNPSYVEFYMKNKNKILEHMSKNEFNKKVKHAMMMNEIVKLF